MHVITPDLARTTTTPNAVVTSLATPALGSTALTSWQVRMRPGAAGPLHTMDKEQIHVVTAGSLTISIGDRTETVTAGSALIVPAGAERRVQAGDEGLEALVSMPAGGQVTVPGEAPRPLPWAQ
ncbi:cupin domain-containing protein [Streptomyces sp. N2-109]|uniref:Cupin domain-containing protein n=1 Tax=Streptomyces gossypii TaxID=2883101 RepID=A0ABT2JN24_9ACTN|nr:cupin domain-containing protein [Streptomyces gossypii]MCT2589275.1 cupin domain-containing protein [Streptomyces gossypii]